MQLHEEHRPKTWAEVIGQDAALARIEALRARGGLGGRAYWVSGASGTGKTTIARLIAAELADEWGVEEIDAAEVTAEACENWRRNLRTRMIGKGGRAVIVNEAHGLRKESCRRLLTILEDLPPHVVFVFTLTSEGAELLFDGCDDAHPLISRCCELPLARRGLAEPFAAHAQRIALGAGLDGRPLAEYLRLAKDCKNNLRQMLQRIEAGRMKAD